ncbi:hypothetical protein N0O92_18235 [Alkalihalobacillus sp. MEB130]|uniref:hypothetical protein n=1 Tax=Alkalihalobacillus sp. MEB130 TaxID=2976704 RepID=UPI0028DFBE09|nr:hypothetical protein [Alkalihalobacillus sp. MEB130]MDT8862152.1 hypothetical protein [Alkalihalobacillus sp. MEB130]
MDEFLQEQLWVMKKEYKILNVDFEKNTIKVLLEWGVRELSEQEQLSFMYREVDSKDWTELEVTNRNGLNYSLEYTFPLRGNYETQILASSTEGKRSETLLNLEFKQLLDTRIMTDAYLHYSENGHVDFNVNIHNLIEAELNLTGSKESFKIKTAKAFLYVNGTVNREFDLLAGSQDFHSDEYSEYLNYHNYVDLEGEVQDLNEVELRVIVEDGLGLTYETIAEAMQY